MVAPLSMMLLTYLLLLSPLNCTEERDRDHSESVNGVAGGKMSRAGRVFCSASAKPDQLVMFQYSDMNSTLAELSDCSEIRFGSNGEDSWGNKKISVLVSVPIIPDGPQVQLSFYDWHGNITPTGLNDSDLRLTTNNWITDAFAIGCTLTNYEAKLTAKRGKFTKETRAMVHCDLSKISHQVIPDTVPLSVYMTQNIYKVVQEVAKLVSFYQWEYSSLNHKISGLDIVTLNLTSPTRQNVTTEEFQITASLSFSTSLQPLRVSTVPVLEGLAFFGQIETLQTLRVSTVAVLVKSTFRQFENMNDEENHNEPQLEGFSTHVFKAAAELLPYHFSYKLVPFDGSSDQLVEEVARETFDAAVGGIVITAKNAHLVDYSQPYAELGLNMVVKKKGNQLNEVFWFMSAFTREMWLCMVAMTVFTGFVIWLIEHRTRNNESDDSRACRQAEAIFCFPFASLFIEQRPRNRLSYFLLVPWLMLTLVVTTTFTTSLGSIVTSSEVVPSDLDIDSLKRTNAAIACDGNPFAVSYLEKNLGFKPKNIRNITSIDDYCEVLSSGNITAAFLLTPDAKVFLAKYYRKGFTKSGPTFNLGSLAFVFPRGSLLASDMSEAILELKEAGELKQMEKDMLSSEYSSSTSDETVSRGIGPGAFSSLFILSGGASASALLITVIDMLKKRWESHIRRLLMGRGLIRMWLTILFTQHNQTRNELQLPRISSNIQT